MELVYKVGKKVEEEMEHSTKRRYAEIRLERLCGCTWIRPCHVETAKR